jgi:rhodanese-related sulfurtransferase
VKLTRIPAISPQELSERLQGPNPPLLLDCREADEWQHGHIERAVHIPMSEIRSRLRELEAARDVVVYCHHGIRSRTVCEFLQRQGLPRVANLTGGIDAWSREIDPQIPRY